MEKVTGEVIFDDYPKGKFAKKIDWWNTDEGLDLIRGWRAQGLSIKQVCGRMGIDLRTLRSWRKKYPDFDDVLKIGKEVTIARVEHSLYQRALGYDYEEEVWELIEGELRLTKKFKKHMPPDVKAILHFLYNRDPQHWRSIQESLESTQYVDSVKNVLVAMKEVAETGKEQVVNTQYILEE